MEAHAAADGFHDGTRIDSLHGITSYPEVRYRGFRVYPEHWHPESKEPLLYCRMMGDEVTRAVAVQGLHDALEKAARTRKDEDAERWRTLAHKETAASMELQKQLVAEGWENEGMDGLVRYLHVGELEKIEGPPPDGPF